MPAASASLDEHHRALILHTLQQCAGNLSATARRLGISRGRVYRAVQAEPG
jgi:transcriptional regulator of acetoin/glycerol metabolism